MKKQFLTAALLATVAVGSAFALQTKTSEKLVDYSYNPGSGCTTITQLPENCGSGNLTCTVDGATLFEGSTCNGDIVKRHN